MKSEFTLHVPSKEFLIFYHQQETERYNQPHKPWVYLNEDGSTSVVAPICAKKPSGDQKPRTHGLLAPDRPGHVVLLTLARDAASRMPDGVGTKKDLIHLIKQSQWFVDSKASNLDSVIFNAVERLH